MKTIIAVGTYDCLQIGHIRLLEFARSLGDYLVVAIDSDERTKEKKGNNRPIFSQNSRREMLRAIKYVGGVFIFANAEQLISIIKNIEADTMVIGHEYKGKEILGIEYVRHVEFFSKPREASSTEIINKLYGVSNRE